MQFRRIRALKRTCMSYCAPVVITHHNRMASNCCKKAFSYMGFSGESVQRFTLPQARWPLAPIFWSIYRTFLAIYLTVWLILILSMWGEPPYYRQADSKAKWLIYVSDWSFLVLVLYLIIMAVGNVYHHATNGCRNPRVEADVDPESNPADPEGMIPMSPVQSSRNDHAADGHYEPQEPLPWYFKFAWFLQTIAFTSGLFVALNYYILVFDPVESTLHAFNFHVHGVNVIIITLELVLSAMPMRVLHMVYPATFALIFFIFTLIYEAAGGLNEFGGTAIYPNYLDWDAVPGTSAIVMALVVLVAAPVLHLIWYAIYRIRYAISKCCTGSCWSF